MPIKATPEALVGQRRGDDPLAAGATIDRHFLGMLSENAVASFASKDSDSLFQCRCHLGIVLRAPTLANGCSPFFARPFGFPIRGIRIPDFPSNAVNNCR